MILFLIALFAVAAIYFIFAKERKRQAQVALREAEFLASARSNARVAAAPLVSTGMMDTVPGSQGASGKDVPAPVTLARSPGAEAVAPNACALCGQPVNAQGIDESARAIRLPLSGSDRLAAFHAKCVALRLRESDALIDKVADVIEAFDAVHDDAAPQAFAQSAEERLRNAVNVARQALAAKRTQIKAGKSQ
jgi:hypothetical protein